MANKYLNIELDDNPITTLINQTFHDLITQGDIIYVDGMSLYVTSISINGEFKTVNCIADFLEKGIDITHSCRLVLKRYDEGVE